MKIKVKSFLQFINENHKGMDNDSSLADLANLYSLGMIDDVDYLKDALPLLKSSGAISSLEPSVSREPDNLSDDPGSNSPVDSNGYQTSDRISESDLWKVTRNWTGLNGEKILKIESLMGEVERVVHVLLNTGLECTFTLDPEDGEWDTVSIEITAGDQTFTKDDLPIDFEDPDDKWTGDGAPSYLDGWGLGEILDVICEEYGILAIDALVKKSM
jgi:hypothetical protein